MDVVRWRSKSIRSNRKASGLFSKTGEGKVVAGPLGKVACVEGILPSKGMKDEKVAIDDEQGVVSERVHIRAHVFIGWFILKTVVGEYCCFSLGVAGSTLPDVCVEQGGHQVSERLCRRRHNTKQSRSKWALSDESSVMVFHSTERLHLLHRRRQRYMNSHPTPCQILH